MKELDVMCNNNLKELDVSDNFLTKLDVSINPELSYLDCSRNQLIELDIKNNPALKDMRCDCKLTQVDREYEDYEMDI